MRKENGGLKVMILFVLARLNLVDDQNGVSQILLSVRLSVKLSFTMEM